MYMFAIPKFMKNTVAFLYTFHTVVSLIIEQTGNVKNSNLEQTIGMDGLVCVKFHNL